jgi:RNA polymerase sigma factor (sigma-70 family)
MNKDDAPKLCGLVNAMVTKYAKLRKDDFDDCVGAATVSMLNAIDKVDKTYTQQQQYNYVYSAILNCIRNFTKAYRRDCARLKYFEGHDSDIYRVNDVDATEQREVSDSVEDAINDLITPREKAVLIHHYGLYDVDSQVFREISAALNKGTTRIYNIEQSAFTKLRKSKKLQELHDV